MAISKTSSSSGNETGFLVAGQPVSKRTYQELHDFLAWVAQFMNPRINEHDLEREWLHLARDPQFQDKQLRRGQAEIVIRVATNGVSDSKSTGRLLTTRCLAGVGKIRQEKGRAKRAEPVRARGVVAVQGGEAVEGGEGEMVTDGGQLGDVGANGDADGDEMEIDGHTDLFGSNDENDDDSMDLDEASNFNDSGLPPSSPTPGSGMLPPKTPVQHRAVPGLPTPDSTPFAQWPHGQLLTSNGRKASEVERENVELRSLVMHMGARLREQQYDAEVTASERLIEKWTG